MNKIKRIENPFITGGHHIVGLRHGFYTTDENNIDAPDFLPTGCTVYSPGYEKFKIDPAVVTGLCYRVQS